jgi:tRNA-2-methylthio-N6-dimethylallyladenosine synthase
MVAVGFQNAHPILDFKPQDMHESVLHVIAKHPNICKHSFASSIWKHRILKEMNRLHTREEYMTLIEKSELLFQTALFRYDYRFPYRNRERPSRYVEFNGICEI